MEDRRVGCTAGPVPAVGEGRRRPKLRCGGGGEIPVPEERGKDVSTICARGCGFGDG
jgi:hypothetical protein